jgi:hypothetical protein
LSLYEVLKVFESENQREGRAAKRFEKLVEHMSIKLNDDVVFGGDIAEGGGDTWGE